MQEKVTIRLGTISDRPFVLASWLRGYRYGSSYGRAQRNWLFFPTHHAVADEILDRGATHLLVAHVPNDPSVIVGFLVHEGQTVLHWVHVKENFRRYGIARALIEAAGLPRDLKGVELSHVSDDWFDIRKTKCPESVYLHARQFWAADFWPAGIRPAPPRAGGGRMASGQTHPGGSELDRATAPADPAAALGSV